MRIDTGVIAYEESSWNGLLVAGFVSELPFYVPGGSPDTHILFTVTSPFYDAYVFDRRTPCVFNYFQEKIGAGKEEGMVRAVYNMFSDMITTLYESNQTGGSNEQD